MQAVDSEDISPEEKITTVASYFWPHCRDQAVSHGIDEDRGRVAGGRDGVGSSRLPRGTLTLVIAY